MTQTNAAMPAETGGTEITRFNALRHGMLSRYTVLPWEDADEYRALVAALAAQHAPQGPTEEHLVEELAGILWRKRRLRLAEAAAHRRGLDGTLGSYRETVKVALVHLDDTGQSESAVDAIRATATDTEEEIADMAADEAMTRRACSAQSATTRMRPRWRRCARIRKPGKRTCSRATPTNWTRARRPPSQTPRVCAASSKARYFHGSRPGKRNWRTRPLIREQAFGEALDAGKLERLGRYEVHLDRKLERMLAMLLRLKDLRQGAIEA
jgi:hypothetical protein